MGDIYTSAETCDLWVKKTFTQSNLFLCSKILMRGNKVTKFGVYFVRCSGTGLWAFVFHLHSFVFLPCFSMLSMTISFLYALGNDEDGFASSLSCLNHAIARVNPVPQPSEYVFKAQSLKHLGMFESKASTVLIGSTSVKIIDPTTPPLQDRHRCQRCPCAPALVRGRCLSPWERHIQRRTLWHCNNDIPHAIEQ